MILMVKNANLRIGMQMMRMVRREDLVYVLGVSDIP